MPTIADLLQSDVDFLVADLPTFEVLPVVVSIDGIEYPCAKNTLRRDSLQEVEGLRDRYRFSIYVAEQRLGTAPDVDDLVVFDGKNFVILAKTSDDIEQLLRLDVGEEFGDFPPLM